MLRLKNVNSFYGESRVIADLNFHAPKGKITCLIGRNGVGKSTTLKSIMGLVKTNGVIELDGADISRLPTYDRARRGIGYVPQGRDIFPQMFVSENWDLGLVARGGGKMPEYIFKLFPILPDFAGRKGGDLSGGQQQQLAIARALACEPKILILDEPTEGIQPSIIKTIGETIRKVNRELGMTVLLVEQYLDFALEIADNINIMEKGDIVYRSEREEFDKAYIQKMLL
jgi:urea transport system ATP-binding protein